MFKALLCEETRRTEDVLSAMFLMVTDDLTLRQGLCLRLVGRKLGL